MAETLTIEIKDGGTTSGAGGGTSGRGGSYGKLPEPPGLMQAAMVAARPIMPNWALQAMSVYQNATKQLGAMPPAAPAAGGNSALTAAAVGGAARAATTLAVAAPAAPVAAGAAAGGAASAGVGAAAMAAVGGPVGLAIVVGLGVVGFGLKKVADAANKLSERLSPYSGSLAVARAQADVRQTLGDMRRANYLGTDLARFTTAQSNLSQSGQDLLASILKPLVPLVTKILDALTFVVDGINGMVAIITEIATFVGDLVTAIPGVSFLVDTADAMIETVKGIYKEIRGNKSDDLGDVEKMWGLLGMPMGFDAQRDTDRRLQEIPGLPGIPPGVFGAGPFFGGRMR